MAGMSLRLRTGDIVRIRAERWVVQQQAALGDLSTLDVRGVDTTNGGQRARFLLPFEPIERMTGRSSPEIVRPGEWRRVVSGTLAAATSSPDALRAAARADFEVMPYQLEPALAVTNGLGCRLLIADDVGLGKTVQAGLIVAEMLERHPGGRALIVCPAGLRAQWQQELWQRFGLSALLLDGAGVGRLVSAHDTSANPWAAAPVVVTSIDFIKRPEVLRAVEGLVWDVLVLDEAHNLASRSDRSTAAGALAWRARTVVMLSATPHSGDAAAFARLAALGDVSGTFPLLLFRRTRSDAGIPIQRRTRWLHVRPTAAEARMHAALVSYAKRVWREREAGEGGRLAMTVLLRRAASSAESLARSVERRLAAIVTGQTDAAAQLTLPFVAGEGDEEPSGSVTGRGLVDATEERQVLEQLRTLARSASMRESKITALSRWIRRVREPVVIFTEYRDTLERLRRALSPSEIAAHRIVELHGGMTRGERERAEHRFAVGDADVLLATDAASEGLNLHHGCRCVVNLEIPWSPVRLEQRIGRVDRIGQRRRVHALHLVASGTFEMTTVRRLVERASSAADALRDTSPSHETTATVILDGVDIPTIEPAPMPAAIRRVALAPRAWIEARDIMAARQQSIQPCRRGRRPVVTITGRSSHRLLCGYDVTVADAAGLPVWSTIVGLDVPVCMLAGRPTCRDARKALEPATRGLDDLAARVAMRLSDRAQDMMRAVITLGVEREQALVAAVRLRHARIAADLLQPGLFDRRAERLATSQSLVLEEALGRCHARLESLQRLATLTSDPPTLRFAIFTR
jgi:superfamily II DNA or RNA helicase